jgi:hypothetical protein
MRIGSNNCSAGSAAIFSRSVGQGDCGLWLDRAPATTVPETLLVMLVSFMRAQMAAPGPIAR